MSRVIVKDLDFITGSNIEWERFRNKTVIITGAYGMLLSYVTFTLLWLNRQRDFKTSIIALVRDREKARKVFEPLMRDERLKFFVHDLSSSVEFSENLDFIIHGASPADPKSFADNPAGAITPNVVGTYYLLELARAKKVEGFLFFSSGAVYGVPLPGMGEKLTEEYSGWLDPLDPANCYGESKRAGETMCRAWLKQHGVPAKIVRPTHNYEPTMDIESDRRAAANFIKRLVRGENIVLQSAGMSKRSFTYVADSTVAFFKVLLEAPPGEAYNVGNDAAYLSVREFAEMAVSVFPEKQLWVIAGDSNAGEYRILMSSKKLQALGWTRAFPPHGGIRRTVDSFLER